NSAHRPAIDAHAQLQLRMLFLHSATDLQRAFYWIFRAVIENQRHPIAGGNLEQAIFTFRFAEFVRRLDNLIQLFNGGALIVDRHFGISDDVDEEDMRDLERDLLFYFGGHLLARIVRKSSSYIKQRSTSESFREQALDLQGRGKGGSSSLLLDAKN